MGGRLGYGAGMALAHLCVYALCLQQQPHYLFVALVTCCSHQGAGHSSACEGCLRAQVPVGLAVARI